MNGKRKGFTLVELMTVVAIMAILAAAATPVFAGYVKRARASVHLAECRTIYVAVQTVLEESRAGMDEPDLEDLLDEIRELTGIDEIDLGETPQYASDTDISEAYRICLEDGEDGVVCTAVIYLGGGDGVWIFDTEDGTFTEVKKK